VEKFRGWRFRCAIFEGFRLDGGIPVHEFQITGREWG
jgi:hypothetical protein